MLLVLIVVVALIFDFTNGAHDCANAIATVVSTKVLSPRVAVVMAASLNFIGAFLGTKVATTLGAGDRQHGHGGELSAAGARRAARGHRLEPHHMVFRHPFLLIPRAHRRPDGSRRGLRRFQHAQRRFHCRKILLPLILSPLAGFGMGFLTMFLIMLLCARANRNKLTRAFTKLQIVSAAFMATSHGLNDAQKTMGRDHARPLHL